MRKKVRVILQGVMLLQGVFWIGIGIITMINGDGGWMDVLISALMLADGIFFIGLALLIKKDVLLLKIFTGAFLFVNLVLTVTDQMGVYDYGVLVLNIAAITAFLYVYMFGDKKDNA